MQKSYKYASVIGAVSLFGLGGAALLLHDKNTQGTISDDVYWKEIAKVEKRAANVSDDDQIEDLVKLADRLNANSTLMPATATKIADISRAQKEESSKETVEDKNKTMKLVDALNKKSDEEENVNSIITPVETTPVIIPTPIQPETTQTPTEVRQEVENNPKTDDNQTDVQEEEKEGWNEDRTMYYISGIYVTGEQEIDGDMYYFRDNGEVYDGWRSAEDDNGNEIRYYYKKGKRASGRTEVENDFYFFDKESGIMRTNEWYTPKPNEKYYYGNDGKEVRGNVNIDGNIYSFDEDGKLMTGLHKEKYKGIEIEVYSDGSGKKVYGKTVTVDGKKYKLDAFTGGVYDGEWDGNKYKDADGNYVTGKQIIAGRTLMFAKNNEMVTFWYKDAEGNFYFADPNSGELVTGLVKIDGKYYYFDKQTNQAKKEGWTTGSEIGLEKDGKVYFVNDGENPPYLAVGKTKIGDDEYMFDENGILIVSEKDNYFTDQDGKVQTGEQTVDGKERFYDPNTGKRIVGWYTDKDNKTYYYTANDGKAKGDRIIDGVTFKFDESTGELLSRGLNGEYFVNDDGSIYKGLKDIDGKTYYFDPNHQGKMAKGFTQIPGKYNNGKAISAYFDEENGAMKLGVLNIEGQEYYATKDKGLIRDDIVERDGNKYYYRSNGVLFKNGKIKSGSKTITSDENGVVTSVNEGLENPLLPANGTVETHPMGNPKQPGNPFAPGWCTTWAYDRFYEVYGYDPGFRGNGESNARELVAAHGDKFKMSSTPVAGAIFSIPSGVITGSADAAVAGHVGFVEKVEGDTMYVSEGAYGSRGTVGYVKYSISSFYNGKAQYAVPVDAGF